MEIRWGRVRISEWSAEGGRMQVAGNWAGLASQVGLELAWKEGRAVVQCLVRRTTLHRLPEAAGATGASHTGEILAFSGQEEQRSG